MSCFPRIVSYWNATKRGTEDIDVPRIVNDVWNGSP